METENNGQMLKPTTTQVSNSNCQLMQEAKNEEPEEAFTKEEEII
jgi:hypothetical protein